MSDNIFAPYAANALHFIVKNITSQPKVVNIFNWPIQPGQTRDLMQIPGVSEESIRASLLKGEIREKLITQNIQVIYSDVDLVQFNTNQAIYLTNIGITTGVYITVDQTSGIVTNNISSQSSSSSSISIGGSSISYLFINEASLIGLQNGINRAFFTSNIFIDGYYQSNYFCIEVFHNGRKLVKNIDFTISESAGIGTGYNTVNFKNFSPISSSVIRANYVIEK
jgi:hypothetical protein